MQGSKTETDLVGSTIHLHWAVNQEYASLPKAIICCDSISPSAPSTRKVKSSTEVFLLNVEGHQA